MIIIYDKRLPDEYRKALKERFPSSVLHPFNGSGSVYESILCHPDIYFFQLDDNTLIHAPGLPEGELNALRGSGVNLVKGKNDPRYTYPATALYNAVRIGKCVFHNLKYTDPVILEKAREKRLKLINVTQGYTRCSVLAVNETALITADETISEAARGEGMDVLQISPGSIFLPGERYGFFGGAGGRMPDGTVLILGDIDRHPEAARIEGFMENHASQCFDLDKLPLYDAGGLFILPQK